MSFVPVNTEEPRRPPHEYVAENFRKLARALRGDAVSLSEPSGYTIEHLERR